MLIDIFLVVWASQSAMDVRSNLTFEKCIYRFIIDVIALKLFRRWKYVFIIRLKIPILQKHPNIHIFFMEWRIMLFLDEIRCWILNSTSLNSILTSEPGQRRKITTVNSVDVEKLLRVNWEWSAAQWKAQTYKML